MMFFGAGKGWHPHRPCSAVPADGGGAPAADAPAQSEEGRAGTRLAAAGVLDELSSAFTSARAVLSRFLDLMSLEARRAGIALMWMLVLGVVAAVCMVAAWLGLAAALAMWAVSLGFPPIAALIAVAVINLIAGAVLIYGCIGMSRDLIFAATRRQLAGKSPVKPTTP